MKKSKLSFNIWLWPIIIFPFSLQIDKLKQINQKLRNKIKELNIIVEKAIEKANAKKLASQKEAKKENVDIEYLIKIRDKEIANSEKQIKNNQIEIDKL